MKVLRCVVVVCSLFSLFLPSLYGADAELCTINPGSRKKEITVECSGGDVNIQVDRESGTEFDSDDSYRLRFSKTLFSSQRVVHVNDKTTQQEILRVEVTAPQQAKIRSVVAGKTWVFEGLVSSTLERLSISTRGVLVIADGLQLSERLIVKADSFYLLNPFHISKGTFKFTYQDGYIVRLDVPFKTRTEGDYSVNESLSTVNCPSKRRINLDQIPHQNTKVSVPDFLVAYREAFGNEIGEKYPSFLELSSDSDKVVYIQQHILPQITDNKKKGIIGETIHRLHMARKYPDSEFRDVKMGLNSFDAVHIRVQDPKVRNSAISDIFITETKYAVNGKPILGVVKMNGMEWRQLSLPYVKSRLNKMLSYNKVTKRTALQILDNPQFVKLELAVFNPNSFDLVMYSVGDMERSLLD